MFSYLFVLLLSVASTSVAGLASAEITTLTTTSTTAPAPTAKASSSISCSYEYCDGSSSWCYYWGGITSYDVSRGPVPGVTRSPIGSCDPATYTVNTTTTTTAQSTILD